MTMQEYQVFPNAIYLAHSRHIDNQHAVMQEIDSAFEDGARVVSNSGGIQSNDLLGRLTPALQEVYDEVTEYVYDVYSQWGLARTPECTGMWANVNHKGNYNLLHSHSMTTMSAVYYVSASADSGNLVFERPDNQHLYFPVTEEDSSQFITRVMEVTPQDGGIIIFPSYIFHRVDTNMSDEPRVSIAFNYN